LRTLMGITAHPYVT